MRRFFTFYHVKSQDDMVDADRDTGMQLTLVSC